MYKPVSSRDQQEISNTRAPFNIFLISYHSSRPCWSHLRHNHREEDILHNPHNPGKPLDEEVSAREDPKALYRAAYKPQTDDKNCWSCCIKHVSLSTRLAVKTKSFLLQNMLEYIPCSMQVPLQVRKGLYARRASVMGNLKGFYLLKFREEKRTKCPSLHWPPFSGCCHFLHIRWTQSHRPVVPQFTQARIFVRK